MTIRTATPADLDAIAAIQNNSPEASHWNPADYLDHDCLVAETDHGDIAGFLVSRDLAGEREILNVAVSPVHRRLGLARELVHAELARPAAAWFLEVRESNRPARNLYIREGFREVGKRPGYYENPPESAIVMRFLS